MLTNASLVLCYLAGVLRAQSFDELSALYRYETAALLDAKLENPTERSTYTLYGVSYANPQRGRTGGLLVVPKRQGRKPAIIWMRSGGPVRWLGNAVLMAQAGALSLLVNPPGPPGPTANNPEGWRDFYVQSVIGLRRGVDLLSARNDVDPQRIAFVGHSFGAMMGAVATSVDRRFRAAVYEGGLLGMSVHIANSTGDPWAENIRQELGTGLDHFLNVISVVDATHYIGHAPAIPKLFQSAYYDDGVPRRASEKFFEAASRPKQLKWYESGHDIDDIAAIGDRVLFLGKALGLKDVKKVLRRTAGL